MFCQWLAPLSCGLGFWIGSLGLSAGKEVRKIPLASCEHLPLRVGVWWGERCLAPLLAEGRRGPALSSLEAAEGWAEGNQSISQAILSPRHPGGPLESQAPSLPSSFQLG